MIPTKAPRAIALAIAIVLVAITLLPLTGCAGFQLGSVVYCAKDDACTVDITKPKAAPATAAPASSSAK